MASNEVEETLRDIEKRFNCSKKAARLCLLRQIPSKESAYEGHPGRRRPNSSPKLTSNFELEEWRNKRLEHLL